MSRETIQVSKREVPGKKARVLRRDGILPANIYGPKTESVAVQLDMRGFNRLFKVVGTTDLFDVHVEGEKEPRPVLIHDLQTNPVTGDPLHADFFEVDLTSKIEMDIPIEFVGEAPAVRDHLGLLLEVMSDLHIKVLPTEIPHTIEVDISSLEAVGDTVTLESVVLPEGVELLATDLSDVVAKIEAEVEIVEEEEEETEAVEGEGEEGGEDQESGGDEESSDEE